MYQGDDVPCTRTIQTILYRAALPAPIAIPDGNSLGATVSLQVPANVGPIAGLGVLLGLRHSRIGDLTVTLTKGTRTVTLFEKVGAVGSVASDTSDLDGFYLFKDDGASLWAAAAAAGAQERVPPGLYAPARANDGALPSPSLSVLGAEPASGIWVLRVRDLAQGETGFIDSFSLVSFTEEATCPSPCPSCAADFNVDGGVDGADAVAFYGAWEGGEGCADVNLDGGVDGGDVVDFFRLWEQGGC
jgi:subtilisin-like proprotein convertase family protein